MNSKTDTIHVPSAEYSNVMSPNDTNHTMLSNKSKRGNAALKSLWSKDGSDEKPKTFKDQHPEL